VLPFAPQQNHPCKDGLGDSVADHIRDHERKNIAGQITHHIGNQHPHGQMQAIFPSHVTLSFTPSTHNDLSIKNK
ncbi:hypothetical protein, partial [Enterobacter intestinihominis]